MSVDFTTYDPMGNGTSTAGRKWRLLHPRVQDINVLVQPRQIFDETLELAQNIREVSLIHPLTVVEYDENGACTHLRIVNKLWGTGYQLEDLVETSTGRYLILLAGERRYRAVSSLGWYRVEAKVWSDLDPFFALSLQFAENIHHPLPAHREAEAYDMMYRLLESEDRKPTLAEFARKMGRSPETIRKALRFTSLPLSIRELVSGKTIRYGHAVELARLADFYDEGKLLRLATHATASDMRVEEFRAVVNARLAELRGDQQSFFGDAIIPDKVAARRVVEPRLVRGIHAQRHYADRVLDLISRDLLGKPTSPFSGGSPARVVKLLLEQYEKMIDVLGDNMTRKDYYAAKQRIVAMQSLLNEAA
jgi:ParB/RepB/Spo0J family partition protein